MVCGLPELYPASPTRSLRRKTWSRALAAEFPDVYCTELTLAIDGVNSTGDAEALGADVTSPEMPIQKLQLTREALLQ